MSVRTILVLLALPLFLLLAAVNSLLLYREESSDIEAGLRGQAMAAAVTVAEFAREASDPFTDLAQPRRLAALRASSKEIPGLAALYLVEPGKPPLHLLDRPAISPRVMAAPARPMVIGTWHDRNGRPLISAVAPAGRGAMIVADIDAEPLARATSHLKRLSITLIAGAAMLAILLGLILARRVTREFRQTRAIIEAHGRGDGAGLSILEVRELADAIGLIDKSVTDDLARLGSRTLADSGGGIAALRARHFPDVSESLAGATLAIRTLPGAAAGCFHIHKSCETGFRIVLGELGGEPAQALASAIALRDFVAAGPVEEFDRRLALGSRAFGVEHSIGMSGEGGGVCALHGPQAAMRDYAARNPGLDADALAADLAILFPDAGIIAAVKPAGS